jgi:ParB/RepB/Spo0J family partition protein
MNEDQEQTRLAITDEQLLFEVREMPMDLLRDVETPIPPKRELVESIKLVGMLQPPIFREDADGNLDIVIGRRRIAAARLAGLEMVRVFVAKTSAAVADVMTLAENAIRSANTVTEFEAIERLTKQGMDIKTIRALTGMAQQTIKKRQALLRLAPELTDAFKAGKMTATVADGAAKLPTAVQKELIYSLIDHGKITATDLHEVRQARAQSAMQSDLFDNLGEGVELETGTARCDEPIEAVLAAEIQSAIERLPDYISKGQRSIVNALSWAAARLIDLSMGSEDDELQSAYEWDSVHPERDDQISTFLPQGELVREIDPKYVDAPVEQPNRVFTLTPIAEDISTSDLPAGNPPPRKPRKPRKKMVAEIAPTPGDDEDAFMEGFVG